MSKPHAILAAIAVATLLACGCSHSVPTPTPTPTPAPVPTIGQPLTTHQGAVVVCEPMEAVTDSTTNTWGGTITGGGADHVLAYCDGTNWTVAAK